MEGLVYAANGLYVVSYFVGDILRLRVLTVTAASCLATYFYTLPEPMWTVFGWNIFFVCLNLLQIGRELRSRAGRMGGIIEFISRNIRKASEPEFRSAG